MTGYELYWTPEFLAVCKLLGIPWDLKTIDMTIELTEDRVIVVQKYECGKIDADEPSLVDK